MNKMMRKTKLCKSSAHTNLSYAESAKLATTSQKGVEAACWQAPDGTVPGTWEQNLGRLRPFRRKSFSNIP